MATATARDWKRDNASLLAAAVAFYAAFSLGPLLVLVVSTGALLFTEQRAQAEAVELAARAMGPQTGDAVARLLRAATAEERTGITLVSAVLLFLSASAVFRQLRLALNIVLDVPPREGRGLVTWLRSRVIATLMVVATLVLLLTAVAATSVLAAIRRNAPSFAGFDVALWTAVDFVLTTLVVAFIFGGIVKFVPDVRLRWRHVAVGSLAAAVLFTAGRYAISLYIARSELTSLYGAAASLFVVLLAIFFGTALLLLAAELTEASARHDRAFREERDRLQHDEGVVPMKGATARPPVRPLTVESRNSRSG